MVPGAAAALSSGGADGPFSASCGSPCMAVPIGCVGGAYPGGPNAGCGGMGR